MMRAVSKAATPSEVQAAFGLGMRRLRSIDGYFSASVRGLEPGTYKITRKLLDSLDVEANREAQNPWRDWDSLPILRGGLVGSIIARGEPVLLHHLQATDEPHFGDDLSRFRCMAALPLYDGGKPLNWAFYLAHAPEQLDAEFVEEFLAATNLIGGTVRNVLVNQKLRAAEAEQSREIDRIATIQRALLPDPLPTIPGARLGAHFATFDRAGGDLYAGRPVRLAGTDETWWMLLIADASGHGPSAAVVAAMVDAIVATTPEPIAAPARVLETVNDYLVAKSVESGFVTAFLGLFHPGRRELRYARAGHNPPLVRSACSEHTVRLLEEAGDIPLGLATGLRFEEATTTLEPGETLVLYTDGIVEARNPDGSMFGVGRIEESLRSCSGAPDCAVRTISGSLLAFESGVRPADDQTLLVLQVGGDCGGA